MTRKEMFEQMINGTIDAEVLRAYAEKELAKLAKADERAVAKKAEKAVADEPIIARLREVMSYDTYMSATEIVKQAEIKDLTVSKVSSLCKKMVDVTAIDGKEIGAGNHKVYKLVG